MAAVKGAGAGFVHSNAHTHTSLCDGQNTPAEMAAAAWQLGFESLGFSGHSFCPADGYGMGPAALAQYRQEVLALREEYRGRLAIYLGLELDSLSEPPEAGLFDYLIGSVHNLVGPSGRVWPIDADLPETQAAIADFGGVQGYVRAYFAAVDEMLAVRPVQIAGHFDLLCKYNAGGRLFDESSPEYKKIAAAVLRRHCRNNKVIFEINTGAMCRGYLQRPYPDDWLWEILREEKAWVMVNSDAHSAANLAYQLAEQTARAKNFGLRVVTLPEFLGV